MFDEHDVSSLKYREGVAAGTRCTVYEEKSSSDCSPVTLFTRLY